MIHRNKFYKMVLTGGWPVSVKILDYENLNNYIPNAFQYVRAVLTENQIFSKFNH